MRIGSGLAGRVVLTGLMVVGAMAALSARGQAQGAKTPQLVWVDTDVGDDIDDAFALGLIVRSPELKVLGVSTTYGDTEMRARILDRFLAAVGEKAIPVFAGPHSDTKNPMTQGAYGRQAPERKHGDGVAAMLAAIKAHPGEVTLIALGPLNTVGATIERDPATFKKLKRVVMMGGSINRGYGGGKGKPAAPAVPEWNVDQYPKGFALLLKAGVPLYLAPLDSTQIPLETKERDALFAVGNPLTDQLTILYHQWIAGSWDKNVTPTLFDPVAAAYTFRPDLCPMTPMRIAVDGKGLTTKVEGEPNANVCLESDEAGFLKLLLGRLEGKAQ